jgi:hypothetical protein
MPYFCSLWREVTAGIPIVSPVCKPEETLRLLRALFQIADSSRRAWLIAEAEKISRG